MKVEIGQEVLIYTIGNNARHKVSQYKGVVTKIGRKWFYKVQKIKPTYFSRWMNFN